MAENDLNMKFFFFFLKKEKPILGHPNNDAYDEMNPPFLIWKWWRCWWIHEFMNCIDTWTVSVFNKLDVHEQQRETFQKTHLIRVTNEDRNGINTLCEEGLGCGVSTVDLVYHQAVSSYQFAQPQFCDIQAWKCDNWHLIFIHVSICVMLTNNYTFCKDHKDLHTHCV